ncbi:rod shape-determining protein MreC [Candidatus Pelagibacter sp.]|nr:rod shape-determining protein MreC [Candidatus Pelagibacter sp.]
MDTSRDDFVIAIRSAFLKKSNKQRFSLIGLIIFSIIFIVLSSFNFKVINYIKISINEIVYRSSFIVSIPENYVKNTYLKIQDHIFLYEDYKIVKSELNEVKSQKMIDQFIFDENKRLKKIIDDYIQVSDEVVAKVLIDKKSPFLRSIIVNKGSKDNIELGMAVLDGNYLAGKVVEVNYLTSRILLLSDLNSKIPATIEPGGIYSILSGTGKDNGVFQYLKDDLKIDLNSIIYTSGSGGLFKTGIPIGKIDYIKSKDEIFVKFFSNFSQLKFVKIVSYKKKEGE